ncbi:MAG: hypothetical protein ACRDKW_10075, partial [Actinomycetota bacterium]
MEARAPVGRGVRPTVGIALVSTTLRSLLRADLERSGFEVVRDRMHGDLGEVDVAITDRRGSRGRLVTVVVGAEIEVYTPGGTWWFPSTEVDRLGELLHTE